MKYTMEHHRNTLKGCLQTAAFELRVNYNQFVNARGLGDFLIDVSANDWPPFEIASRALDCLCSNRGTDFMDHTVLVAVVYFLDETLGKPVEDPDLKRRLTDLVQVVKNPGTLSAYRNWVASWYA